MDVYLGWYIECRNEKVRTMEEEITIQCKNSECSTETINSKFCPNWGTKGAETGVVIGKEN